MQQARGFRFEWLALGPFVLGLVACGGSSSETPPPLPPPLSQLEADGRRPDNVYVPAGERAKSGDSNDIDTPEGLPARGTWGSGGRIPVEDEWPELKSGTPETPPATEEDSDEASP